MLSSYSFSHTDDGAPDGGEYIPDSDPYRNHSLRSGKGTCSGAGGSGGWLCQHRYLAFTGMVGFRNCVGSAAITDWVSPGTQQIAFGRGTLTLLIQVLPCVFVRIY